MADVREMMAAMRGYSNIKTLLWLALFCVLAAGLYSAYRTHVRYNFTEVAKGRVYSSAAMPPQELAQWIKRYGIRTVVDLRKPGTADVENNPESTGQVEAERRALAGMSGVRYVNVPSDQVPDRNALQGFYKVMDDAASYPVLIHCHHGTGRAVLYSALYRVEYEHMSPADARARTRLLPQFSSFADGKEKGDFLMHYVRRSSAALPATPDPSTSAAPQPQAAH